MDRLENVATPFTAAVLAVPDSVPPPGLLPMATVTVAEEVSTVLPKASCTATRTAGAMATPATALVGCTVNATFCAAAAEMLKAAEVAGVSAPEEAVRV